MYSIVPIQMELIEVLYSELTAKKNPLTSIAGIHIEKFIELLTYIGQWIHILWSYWFASLIASEC